MKMFFLGVLAGVLMAGLFGVVAILVAAKLGSQEKSVESNSTLVLRLEGAISEKPGADMPFAFLGGAAPPTVTDVWKSLKKAAIDPKIKAVVLMPRGLSVGWAKLQEIRGGLIEYKASGKPLFVFLRAPRTPEYYLATAADRIHMVPEDYLDMKGMRAEITYYKGAFDKLGVKMEAEHAGKYKDALDSYTRTNMTPESREALDLLLDGLYGHLSDTVGAARKKSGAEVRKLLDDGPFLADQAVTAGLIDALSYEDQFFDEVKQKLGMDVKRVGLGEYSRTSVDGFEGKNRIAMIVGDGAIVRGQSVTGALDEEAQMTTAHMTKLFHQVAEDASIKGVILRVDSPGGDAVASDEILREAKLLSKKKPMVISMSDVAASGGYYISMTGDPVIAYPNTITGSIGVIYGKVNLKGLYDKLGLTKDVVQRGKNATIDSEYYELDAQGRKKLRDGVESVYKAFVGIVGEGRKKKYEEIDEVAQGRVWLGSDAKKHELIDAEGGLDKAIEMVKEKAKLSKSDKIRLVVYPPKQSLLEQLVAKGNESNVSVDRLVQREIREWTGGMPMELFRQGAILRLMPYRLEIR
jgi:protease-4